MRPSVHPLESIWQKPMRIIGLLPFLLLALHACAFLSPQSTALKEVHQSYREEFARAIVLPPLPEEQREAPNQKAAEAPAFPVTLRAIREFKVTYGEGSREAAHLTVLEGMIYLQSGQFGMAKLIAEDVRAAQAHLRSGTGQYTRDELLAKSFGHLLLGWQQIHNFTDTSDSTIAEHRKLQQAADGIKAALDSLDASKIAQPEVDEGAIYLATTAAIFYVWVYKLESDAGMADATKAKWFTKGYELIGQYLSDTEKKAAEGAIQPGNSPVGRLRYVEWYGYLLKEAKQPA
jgi:hypothetical protein